MGVAFLVGALAPTFLLRALIFYVLKGWNGGVRRVVFANAVALLMVGLVAGAGMADGGAFAPARALAAYAPAQALWLALDLYQLRRKRGAVTERVREG